MADKAYLLELAAKCEAAEGPDRRADAAIAAVTNPGLFGTPEDARHYATYPELNRASFIYFASCGIPRFTASLDAATQLVPEGYHWSVGLDTAFAWASVTHPADLHSFQGDDRHGESSECATPALALTSACLKALASIGESGRD